MSVCVFWDGGGGVQDGVLGSYTKRRAGSNQPSVFGKTAALLVAGAVR